MVDRLPRVRRKGALYSEFTPIKDTTAIQHFPAREISSVTTGQSDPGPRGVGFLVWLGRQVLRHSTANRRTKDPANTRPDAHLFFQDARWFEVPNYDRVLVTNAEGSGVTFHRRDPRLFRKLLIESVRLNLLYRRRWASLSKQYRDALPDITSQERWSETFEASRNS
jgi:galactofuranosylgalactofuranosylrhamnosyl-N-acetylglucosaminyl-diphospho-decaprenol beta-1,5/1,6-galactofuranosyltransferase